MNDHITVRRLKKTYPLVYSKIAPEPVIKDLRNLPQYYDLYISVTGVSKQDIVDNRNDQRTLCVAVFVMLVDPLFFSYADRPTYRFQKELKKVMRTSATQIFYNLRKARNFMKVYPEFNHQVDSIFEKIANA